MVRLHQLPPTFISTLIPANSLPSPNTHSIHLKYPHILYTDISEHIIHPYPFNSYPSYIRTSNDLNSNMALLSRACPSKPPSSLKLEAQTEPSTKSKLKQYLKKLKTKGASVTRSLLERNKHQEVRWKTTPYQLQVTESKKSSNEDKLTNKKQKTSSSPFPSKLKKWMKKTNPVSDAMIIDLTADEVSQLRVDVLIPAHCISLAYRR